MPITCNMNGMWVEVAPFVRHDGVWKEAVQVFAKSDGSWHPTFYTPAAVSLFQRMETDPGDLRKRRINDLIVSLQSAGIWERLDGLWVMAAHDQQSANLNWVANTYDLVPQNSPTFTVDHGYAGNGSSAYLQTGMITNALTHFSRDSAMFASWETTDLNTATFTIGLSAAAKSRLQTRIVGNVGGRLNSTGGGVSGAVPTSVGFSAIDRSSSSTLQAYKNGNLVTTASVASQALAADSIFLLRDGGTYATRQISVASVGASLTTAQHLAFYNAVSDFLSAPLIFSAEAGLVLELPSGGGAPISRFSKSPDLQFQPASLTKLLTAAVSLNMGVDPYMLLTCEASDATAGSGNNLLPGDVITFADALANMLLPSSNVTAAMVARSVGNIIESGGGVPAFLSAMNVFATTSVGMSSSTFTNPHGLYAASQKTTARDMAALMRWIVEHPEITQPLLDVWGLPTYSLSIYGPNARSVPITSSVKMLGEPGIIGGKTGTITPYDYNLSILADGTGGSKRVAVVLRAASDADRYSAMRFALSQ